MVTHETRIREVPGSNPGADQPDWGFSWFSSVIKANTGLDFHYHDSFDHYSSNSYIIKLKSVKLTNETLATNNRNTQHSDAHPKTLDAIRPKMLKRL